MSLLLRLFGVKDKPLESDLRDCCPVCGSRRRSIIWRGDDLDAVRDAYLRGFLTADEFDRAVGRVLIGPQPKET